MAVTGDHLRDARTRLGITLGGLAALTGRDKSHLSRVEHGERPVTPAVISSYERGLGVRFDPGTGQAEQRRSGTREAVLRIVGDGVGGAAPGAATSRSTSRVAVRSSPTGYREFGARDDVDDVIMREVLMAAHEGSEHAEQAEIRGIGDATLEQLHADVARMAVLTDTADPLPTFLEMRRVRARIYRILDRQVWPREQTQLYFLLGAVNGLMGVSAQLLGYADASDELLRSGTAYAVAIDHRPLLAKLRYEMGWNAWWRGRPHETQELALGGLEVASEGQPGADLYLMHARAAGRLGDVDGARRSVASAHEARERPHNDDLVALGGEFVVSLATYHSDAGAALAETDGAAEEAGSELERAIALYEAGPGPREEHWFGGKAVASTNLAIIRLRTGALDGAIHALEPALALPVEKRVSAVRTRLAVVRAELAAPIYQGSAQARQADQEIEEFVIQSEIGLPDLRG